MVEENPTDDRLLQNLSSICGVMGNYEEGLKYAEMWIKVAPEDGEAYKQAGEMLTGLGRYKEAEKYEYKAKRLGVK